MVPEYLCPSDEISPVVKHHPVNPPSTDLWFGPEYAALASYYGVAGPVSTGPTDGSWGGQDVVCGNCRGGVACPCVSGNKPGGNQRGWYHGHNPGGPGMMDMWANKISTAKVSDGTANTLHVGETHWVDRDTNQSGCFSTNGWMYTWCGRFHRLGHQYRLRIQAWPHAKRSTTNLIMRQVVTSAVGIRAGLNSFTPMAMWSSSPTILIPERSLT